MIHLVIEEERGRVGRQDGRVDDQQQDEPVPHGLEGAVVQHRPLVDARSLELVLRQHICTQRQHLGRERGGRGGDTETQSDGESKETEEERRRIEGQVTLRNCKTTRLCMKQEENELTIIRTHTFAYSRASP